MREKFYGGLMLLSELILISPLDFSMLSMLTQNRSAVDLNTVACIKIRVLAFGFGFYADG
jgi:hypothetical protein